MSKIKEQKAITLISLVITIIIMLILANVSINLTLGENGILTRAKEAKERMEIATIKEQIQMDILTEKLGNNGKILEDKLKEILGNYGKLSEEDKLEDKILTTNEGNYKIKVSDIIDGEIAKNEDEIIDKGPNGKPLITGLDKEQKSTIKAEDSKGNPITVPAGFKVRTDLAKTVQQGIVIEDENENQFVWIPVSNINGDGSGKIILDDTTEIEITLGRYTFDENNGKPQIQQLASNYLQIVTLNRYSESPSIYRELSTHMESNNKEDTTATNTTAINLEEFINSTKANNGFYIARFEASYGSGTSIIDYKPLSKMSKQADGHSMIYNTGTLWNCIKQSNAAKICENMYKDDLYVTSDLTNSYAFDTVLVYIQKCSDKTTYSITKEFTKFQGAIENTGTTNDIVCNIYDFAGNLSEYLTETSIYTKNNLGYPSVIRGGNFFSIDYPSRPYSIQNNSERRCSWI